MDRIRKIVLDPTMLLGWQARPDANAPAGVVGVKFGFIKISITKVRPDEA